MRVMVLHAHPLETSYNRSLCNAVVDALTAKGHQVDLVDLYAENFDPVLSREDRLRYHDVPDNITPDLKPYVDRLMAAEGMVVVHPVWNYGFPAILKGYFDKVFMPGVSFVLEGGDGPDKGKLKPNLKHIKKIAFVTSYGGSRWRTMVMGDPPRRMARRWGWVTFGGWLPPTYLALYDMNNVSPDQLRGFIAKVKRVIGKW
ncbi:MAG: NAD(P)H-dependent oxidoreductase [Devosia sp.]|uniref:NAD(P)H-dependent oxidoreductase n=1 Tax=Devosia sp. TaxID=1871048 RepID=UPI001A4A19F0|nr:NAD(P)H-dependent oxidoreductase [Devosia sp.]MBL8599381.1 NAD(P)H-dependent oxidoreductase [Devosia sp.]